MKSLFAVIVAGGMGTRLGRTLPKAFVDICGKPLFIYSLEVLLAHTEIKKIVITVPAGWINETEKLIEKYCLHEKTIVTEGGAERWLSVKNGVDLCDDADWVMIHDAARPFITKVVIDSLLTMTDHSKSVITATPVVDTIRTFEKDKCGSTIDRSKLLRVGTPQLFYRQTLIDAFNIAFDMNPPPTDEVMLMETMGIASSFAWGDPLNFKVTTEEDIIIAESIIERKNNHE